MLASLTKRLVGKKTLHVTELTSNPHEKVHFPYPQFIGFKDCSFLDNTALFARIMTSRSNLYLALADNSTYIPYSRMDSY